ncbi:MAG TPA: tRNA uridine(34) 5-carboxymethylaminomethyl modification radical SAM/GNAT enzyme Elp3, partial [Acidobacteriota bacterium]|nr:tRNA uridine(34) 5-carboxymethylaminomethyl modification radical SAM/GNAT enzyme Elp3 [Acidobacteriota bacterium]
PSLCPHGACTFCPGGLGSPYGDVPMSYTGNEPSTMRGIRNEFDPYRIIFNRLEQYIILGQHPDKCDQIIMGGTFPSFPKEYQEMYCYYSFKAYNDFSTEFFDERGELKLEHFKEFFELPCPVGDKERSDRVKQRILALKEKNKKTLEEEQVQNEKAVIRCIGLTIETKPDWGFATHALEFLRLGATRVELGVQTVYDDILAATNRGHTLADTKRSIQELRDLAFKLNFHIMPGLPTPSGVRIDRDRDIASIQAMFADPAFKPDMIKVYPCMVMPGTPLEKTWKAGIFVPLSTMESADIIVEGLRSVPEWCRIMRVQRDIPTYATTAGVDKTNLRQYVDELAHKRGIVSRDIREREPRSNKIVGEPSIVVREYDAAGGREFFISYETTDVLLGFVRMRYPSTCLHSAITSDSALIRELHVYGQAVAIGQQDESAVQHKGIGKKLMAESEKIAASHSRHKMVVISGVGVREYYRKIGYVREGPYMVKKI